MNWKMFWQIVLLIVIAALVSAALKCGLLSYKYGKRCPLTQGAIKGSPQK